MVGWQDVFRTEPEQPRQLTLHEFQRLHRLGFTTLARQLAAGTCERCGLNRTGTGHRELCVEPDERAKPLEPPAPVLQPWMPRPPRRLREAA